MRRSAPADLSTPVEHRFGNPHRTVADGRDAATSVQGLRQTRGLRQRGAGKGARDPRRDERRGDLADSADEYREFAVLSSGGPVTRPFLSTDSADTRGDSRLLYDG